jgi:hypothetical protein
VAAMKALLIDAAERLNCDMDAIASYISYVGESNADRAIDTFPAAYMGKWDSLEAFAHVHLFTTDTFYRAAVEANHGDWTVHPHMETFEAHYHISPRGHVFRDL